MRLGRRYPWFLLAAAAAIVVGILGDADRAIANFITVPVYDPFAFHLSRLDGLRIENPTALQFGPDGRLYVATRFGLIHRLSVSQAHGGFRVVSSEVLSQIQDIPNHDDRGRLLPALRNRLITGFVVTGTAERTVLFVSSSDPRLEDREIDTNSGVISRLDRTGAGWRRTDLVRGIPRSRFDHAPNGVAFDSTRNVLYISVGSNTNSGAASSGFFNLPEYELSASVLCVDLNRIEDRTYDLPTRDDPARPGQPDTGDPFGGNGGLNQAFLDPSGPISLFATGLRNAYDLVLTAEGLFTIDNGPNGGFGGAPGPDPYAPVEGGRRDRDGLHWMRRPGVYLGHPNPARAVRDPREGRLLPNGSGDDALTTFAASTNGLTEYSRPGDTSRICLLAAGAAREVYKVVVDKSSGRLVGKEVVMSRFGGLPLDIWAQDERSVFPGSIWIADFAENSVFILEPAPNAAGWSRFVSACGAYVVQSGRRVLDAYIDIRDRM
jgi:hypothetical protein